MKLPKAVRLRGDHPSVLAGIPLLVTLVYSGRRFWKPHELAS